jgi:hypothetical protein
MSEQLSGYYSTLSEYTSREARFNLVLMVLAKYRDTEEKKAVSATRQLADQLFVSQRTVQRWAQGGIQSCNVNAEAIINVALDVDPKAAAKVLAKDLDRHRQEILTNIPEYLRPTSERLEFPEVLAQ